MYPVLSDRRNIVVICDEAHRSQYGFEARLVGGARQTARGSAANDATVLLAAKSNTTPPDAAEYRPERRALRLRPAPA
jgi:type I restriction enzyme R subunit